MVEAPLEQTPPLLDLGTVELASSEDGACFGAQGAPLEGVTLLAQVGNTVEQGLVAFSASEQGVISEHRHRTALHAPIRRMAAQHAATMNGSCRPTMGG